jgi:hypothetical protein
VQLSVKAFALIYTSHLIQGSNFGDEKWTLSASDLSCPMYSIIPFVYLYISNRLTKERVGLHWFLGTLTKLRKATISFITSVCTSVHLHGKTRLPMDGFSWNLIFEGVFENLSRKFQFH